MIRGDIIEVLAMLKAAYPHAYRGLTKQDAEAMIALWGNVLRNEDKTLILAAAREFIKHNKKGYAPTVGEVLQIAHGLKGKITSNDDYAMVVLAYRKITGREPKLQGREERLEIAKTND